MIRPMPSPSETLPALEQRLAERLLAFELLNENWPHGFTAIERAEIGRQRNGVLAGAAALQERMVSVSSKTLADVAV